MAELLVDTDVLVDHLRGARELRVRRHTVSYSVITRCELFAGRNADQEGLRELLAPFRELPVDRAVAERAGRLREETAIRTPDALIAATALEHELGLMTRNERDFRSVKGLRLVAPE